MSEKPPSRLAMSPPSGAKPSRVVITATTSWPACGWTKVTRSWSSLRPKVSLVGACCRPPLDVGTPYTLLAVRTRKANGWSGSNEPGGSTGRWTPFWPPSRRNVSRSVKLAKTGLYSALLAPIGNAAPSWEITTPISPGDTRTQGCLVTE